ncbi:PleD family two-component system response regulator [Candidatus Sumerlaeota bacterium]
MGSKAKILAVDDENDVLLIIKTALQAEGYEVVTAVNGPDALETVATEQPDAIILDVMMPGMDGFEVLTRLRADAQTQDTPVIMLTGISDRAKIQEALDKGTQYFIVKPFEFLDLISKVKLALRDAAEDKII